MSDDADGSLRPTWARALCLTLLALALSIYMYGAAIATYPSTQGGDGQFFHRLIESGKVSISRYHELPLWNAYECGGVPLWDNPQSVVASPLMLLMQRLSTTVTMRLWYILHHAAGFVCMWLFSRHDLRLSRAATLVASTVFALTVAHASQYAGGHAALVGFLYAPLALLLWRRAESDRRCAVGLGLLFAWTFYEGGVYPVPHIGLMLAFETVTRFTSLRRLRAILWAGVLMTVAFVTVGAARLFPVADQIVHHKRALEAESDAISWKTLGEMYFARTHEWHVAGQQYVWPEYIAYLGAFVVLLATAGLLLSMAHETWFLAVGVFVFALMMGHVTKWAPWHLLKEYVFPWKSMRVPSRFRLLWLVFLAGWVGFAVDRLPPLLTRLLGRRFGSAAGTVVLGIALIGAGDALAVAMDTVGGKFNVGPEQVVEASPNLYIGGPGMASFIDQPRQNRGRLDCWEEWNFTQGAPQWQGDVPQAKTADASVLTVLHVARTQNTFTIDVDAKAPGRVLVNLPYERGWRTNVGKTADQGKLLVVDVPEGTSKVRLKYWPSWLTLGFVVTGLGLVGVVVFFVGEGRKRRGPP
jgi:hypothetical protein